MYSFDKDTGELAWSHSTGDYVYAGAGGRRHRRTRPPTVYFGSYDGNFYALDAAQRRRALVSQTPAARSSAPASLIGNIVYVANLDTTETDGFNVANGKQGLRASRTAPTTR